MNNNRLIKTKKRNKNSRFVINRLPNRKDIKHASTVEAKESFDKAKGTADGRICELQENLDSHHKTDWKTLDKLKGISAPQRHFSDISKNFAGISEGPGLSGSSPDIGALIDW